MQVFKSLSVGFCSRPIEYRKRFGLCISNYLHVPFSQPPGGSLWGEQSMWNFLAERMESPMLDEGVAKLTPEFLVHGSAYPPSGDAACAVRVRLAATEKTVLAFGERFWNGTQASAPVPAQRIDLTWRNAYGGTDHPPNPLGVGRAAVDGRLPLPSLEMPASRALRPDQAIEPAGFGALDPMHHARAPFRGTYDDSYLKAHAPGFAPDLDWRYFNMAPRDQWLPQALRGDEPFALDHLHPTEAHIRGQLPGLRVRNFANYRLHPSRGGGHKLREVPMRLSTVWFFPDAQRMVLVYQGMAETDEDDGSDIEHLMTAVERLEDARDDAHYAAALALRLDPKDGPLASLSEKDLLPDGLDTTDPAFEDALQAFATDGLQADAQRRRAEVEMALTREQLLAQGKDPDAMGVRMPPREAPPPKLAELPAYLKARQAEMEQQQRAALEDMVDHVTAALKFADANKLDLPSLVHRGPPTYKADRQVAQLVAQFGKDRLPMSEDALAKKLAQREASERMSYLQGAHLQPPARALQGEAARVAREEVEWMLARGLRVWPDIDLTGADLSGLDLRGVDFSGAWLESTNFQNSNVSGAVFAAAVLAHADLRGAMAIGTNFAYANLGRARLTHGVFDQANFTGAILSHCSLAQTQFRRATLQGTQLFETVWGVADWSGVQASGLVLHNLDLSGLVLTEADLSGTSFLECKLPQVNLRGAKLKGSTFVTCALEGAQLQGAWMDGAIFVKGCKLDGADLSQASLRGANLGEVQADDLRLVQAVLDGANLGMGRFSGCDARMASMRSALLRKAVFKRSQLAGVNFQDAVLQHADLRGCDLRHANLFGADLSRARLNADVRLEGALLTRARTWPRLTAQQQAAADALDPI